MWPWRHDSRARAEPPAEPPAAPARPAPPRGEWRTAKPIQRTVAQHPLVNPVERFRESLASWQDPRLLSPLGHASGADEPSGLIDASVPAPQDDPQPSSATRIADAAPNARSWVSLTGAVQRLFGSGAARPMPTVGLPAAASREPATAAPVGELPITGGLPARHHAGPAPTAAGPVAVLPIADGPVAGARVGGGAVDVPAPVQRSVDAGAPPVERLPDLPEEPVPTLGAGDLDVSALDNGADAPGPAVHDMRLPGAATSVVGSRSTPFAPGGELTAADAKPGPVAPPAAVQRMPAAAPPAGMTRRLGLGEPILPADPGQRVGLTGARSTDTRSTDTGGAGWRADRTGAGGDGAPSIDTPATAALLGAGTEPTGADRAGTGGVTSAAAGHAAVQRATDAAPHPFRNLPVVEHDRAPTGNVAPLMTAPLVVARLIGDRPPLTPAASARPAAMSARPVGGGAAVAVPSAHDPASTVDRSPGGELPAVFAALPARVEVPVIVQRDVPPAARIATIPGGFVEPGAVPVPTDLASAEPAPVALQRQAEPATLAPAASVPGIAAGGEPEELLAKLYDPLLRRIKAELRIDRDRCGSLTDLRR